jgi:hypothetical protein
MMGIINVATFHDKYIAFGVLGEELQCLFCHVDKGWLSSRACITFQGPWRVVWAK